MPYTIHMTCNAASLPQCPFPDAVLGTASSPAGAFAAAVEALRVYDRRLARYLAQRHAAEFTGSASETERYDVIISWEYYERAQVVEPEDYQEVRDQLRAYGRRSEDSGFFYCHLG